MPLTDLKVKSARALTRQIKLYDGGGLYLIVRTTGFKSFIYKYRHAGKEQRLSLGTYSEVSLKEARRRRDFARLDVAKGLNPAFEKKRAAMTAKINSANTFEAVAEEYLLKREAEGKALATIAKATWFLSLFKQGIGSRPIAEIEAFELLAVLNRVQSKGRRETAKRMLCFAQQVFRYAIVTTRAKRNPASDLRGALIAPVVKHHPAITDPIELGGLLRAIDGFSGQPATLFALKLAPHVFVRPGELRHAEWAEFDLDQCIWRIPAHKTKMRSEHVVPLSREAVLILKEIQLLTGRRRYVFPSIRTHLKPMSENTLNAALRRLGYGTEEMTTHGFRSTASTLLNESGLWSPDAIEKALAHKDTDQVRAAYHRGTHWSERVRMAQWWSDYLDALRSDTPLAEARAA